DRLARVRVDAADGVELVGLVVARRLVAAALLGDGVNDHRGAIGLRQLERLGERLQVVPVDGAEVFDVELRVQRRVAREAGEEAPRAATKAPVQRAAGRAEAIRYPSGALVEIAVHLARAHPVQV